jgi:hypothetical protein
MQPENSEVSELIRKSRNSCRSSGDSLGRRSATSAAKSVVALEVVVVVVALVLGASWRPTRRARCDTSSAVHGREVGGVEARAQQRGFPRLSGWHRWRWR